MSSTKPEDKTSSLDEKSPLDTDGVEAGGEYVVSGGRLKELDVALSFALGHADDPDLSPAETARLRRKLDWHLLPLLCAIYTGPCQSSPHCDSFR